MNTRPELPATLPPGTPVWVRRSPNSTGRRDPAARYVEARVVSAARVWITIERADLPPKALGHQTWRMRRDTQDEATQYTGSNASFLTVEQYRWDRRLEAAQAVLTEQGISIDRTGPWYGRTVELADILTNALRGTA